MSQEKHFSNNNNQEEDCDESDNNQEQNCDDICKLFDDVIQELYWKKKIFQNNPKMDDTIWIEIRENSNCDEQTWETANDVLGFTFNDISRQDAILICKKWKEFKRYYKLNIENVYRDWDPDFHNKQK